MTSVAPVGAQPTNLAAAPRLLAYTQALGLEGGLARPKRGLSTLALALIWLVLAWRGPRVAPKMPDDQGLMAGRAGSGRVGERQPMCAAA